MGDGVAEGGGGGGAKGRQGQLGVLEQSLRAARREATSCPSALAATSLSGNLTGCVGAGGGGAGPLVLRCAAVLRSVTAQCSCKSALHGCNRGSRIALLPPRNPPPPFYLPIRRPRRFARRAFESPPQKEHSMCTQMQTNEALTWMVAVPQSLPLLMV